MKRRKITSISSKVRTIMLAVAAIGMVLVIAPSTSHGADPAITLSQGTSQSLSPNFFGFNGIQPNSRTSPTLPGAVSQLHAENLRGIIAGTATDYLNWQTGKFFINSSNIGNGQNLKTNGPTPPFTLDTYVDELKATGGDPLFNLNFMTYCPVDNAHPASTDQAGANCTLPQACGPQPADYTTSCTSTDYSWGVDYQIAMLKAAQAKGLPIKYIELGNELYLSGRNDNTYFFSSPDRYVNKANAWIPALKSAFPDAKIAVIGELPVASNATGAAWNQAIIHNIHGEDAISFHAYYPSQIADGGTLDDPQNVTKILAQSPQAAFNRLQTNYLSLLPSGVKAWITEWNIWGENTQVVHGSWGQALNEATYALDMARDPRIELSVNFSLVGSQIYGSLFASSLFTTSTSGSTVVGTPSPLPTAEPYQKTAGGFALSALGRSLQGATGSAPLNFSSSPVIAGSTVPGLMGQSFTVNGKTNLYLMNLSNQATTISLGSLAGHYSGLQYASTPANFVTGDSSIPTTTFSATDSATLPAYSVTSLVADTASSTLRGDITGPSGVPDGKINIFDLSYIIRNYGSTNSQADITGPSGQPDGKVDIFDVSYIVRNYQQ